MPGGNANVIHKMRWTAQKIAHRLALIEPLVYRQRVTLPLFRFTTLTAPDPGPIQPPPVAPDVDDSGWPLLEYGQYWAGADVNFVLRGSFQFPAEWDAALPTALYLPLGEPGSFSHPEALLYVDGAAYAACDRHHQEVLLPAACCDGQRHTLALHGWTGNWSQPQRLFLEDCELVQIDQPTRDFVAAARVALGVAQTLDENEPARGYLLNALNAAFNILDTLEPLGAAFYDSVAPALDVLGQGIAQAGPPLDVSVSATGHAHIDVAWLWTLGQTRRKAGRTFHTVTRLMEQFPDYHFVQSQPQLYDYVRQDYPALFEAIKELAAAGRWEPIGGMWVEADCNISGPESLARQFLLGRTFFREQFGVDAESPVLWLPDVFGYAWSLPQLIKLAGLDYFFTIKIGWNQYNRLPYDSFWWQGLDGTSVLTHFSTANWPGRQGGNYNCGATPGETLGTWINFQQKESQRDILMSFGYGDGGGGPTREMLENLRAMAAFPATPRVQQRPVKDFFRDLEAQSGENLPTWNGELYLEIHRGTYTTQSRNKRANRKSEFLLHDAEFLAAQAALLDARFAYPTEQLRHAWELVCLNQFHDIIPGSSITAVYADSQRQYAEVAEIGTAVRDSALAALAAQAGAAVVIANPTSFVRDDLAFLPWHVELTGHLERADGQPVLMQPADEGTWVSAGALPPYSVTLLRLAEGTAGMPETGLSAAPSLLENNYVRVEINSAGDVTRIYDKVAAREVLAPGAVGGQMQAFEDRPLNWDAWDVDIFYDDRMWLAEPADSVRVVEAGPLRAVVEVRRRILNSDYVQHIALAHNSARIDFDTRIDWRERHVMLKAAFPVDILSPAAAFEIQWGSVQRPTHRNTSWDWARFETAAQKWVDLSEGGYGVSLLNDCKYGHDIRDNVIRISLLRSPTEPDPQADQGEHRFAYSLLPHIGPLDERTAAAAYALNDPLLAAKGTHEASQGVPLPPSLIISDRANVIIETVKQAEDGQGLIVRLYESQRQRGPVTLTAGFALKAAWRTNLLEDNQDSISIRGSSLSLNLRPFEIVTLRLLPA
jgi:alpha-mannosidase